MINKLNDILFIILSFLFQEFLTFIFHVDFYYY